MSSVSGPTLESSIFNPNFYIQPVDITSSGTGGEIDDPLTIGQIDATTLNTQLGILPFLNIFSLRLNY